MGNISEEENLHVQIRLAKLPTTHRAVEPTGYLVVWLSNCLTNLGSSVASWACFPSNLTVIEGQTAAILDFWIYGGQLFKFYTKSQ